MQVLSTLFTLSNEHSVLSPCHEDSNEEYDIIIIILPREVDVSRTENKKS